MTMFYTGLGLLNVGNAHPGTISRKVSVLSVKGGRVALSNTGRATLLMSH